MSIHMSMSLFCNRGTSRAAGPPDWTVVVSAKMSMSLFRAARVQAEQLGPQLELSLSVLQRSGRPREHVRRRLLQRRRLQQGPCHQLAGHHVFSREKPRHFSYWSYRINYIHVGIAVLDRTDPSRFVGTNLGTSTFLCGSMTFHRTQKSFDFQSQTPSHLPS